jgi:GTP-binding protein
MAVRTPIVAIVGRPNVGKSTLFNRIVGERRAVVEDIPGVTRDRNYALVHKYSVPFYVVDTGGFEVSPGDELAQLVSSQAELAAEEADLVAAIFDAKAGCQPGDGDIVQMLRRYDKPVLYLVNKCDGSEQSILGADFYSLGIDRLFDASALHGRGVDDFIETALKLIPWYDKLVQSQASKREAEKDLEIAAIRYIAAHPTPESDDDEIDETLTVEPPEVELPVTFAPVFSGEENSSWENYEKQHKILALSESIPVREDSLEEWEEEEGDAPSEVEIPLKIDLIKAAIIGRPNVGKSTLLNMLTGENRAITSPIAGTTRDSLDVEITRDGQRYLFVDTAGMRRKARVNNTIEQSSILRALRAIRDCDVALVLIDAVSGPSEQDAKILGLAHEEGKGVVLVINKWDLVEKDHLTVEQYRQRIKDEFKFSTYAPIVFVSAKTGRRCPKIIEEAKTVAYDRLKRVPTMRLNRLLSNVVKRRPPSVYRGRRIKLLFAAQVDVAPPRFALFFNYPKHVHFSYLRYLKNSIRDEFGFVGSDIKIAARSRKPRPEKS